jgi:histidyl-tRNA synthetase
LGGKPTPGVGFAAGIERMIMVMNQQKINWPKPKCIDIFIVKVSEENKDTAFRLLQKIRNSGLSADLDYSNGSLKSQMRIANKIGVRYTVIIGEEELSEDMVTLRNMQTKEQKKVKLDEIEKGVRPTLDEKGVRSLHLT